MATDRPAQLSLIEKCAVDALLSAWPLLELRRISGKGS
jgi:hypothetical protein